MDAKLRKRKQAEEEFAKKVAAHSKDVAKFAREEAQLEKFQAQCRGILQLIGLGILVPGEGGVV